MDAAAVSQLIGSLGFPIAACVFLAWYMTSVMKEFREIMTNNTMAIKELILIVEDMKERRDDYD